MTTSYLEHGRWPEVLLGYSANGMGFYAGLITFGITQSALKATTHLREGVSITGVPSISSYSLWQVLGGYRS